MIRILVGGLIAVLLVCVAWAQFRAEATLVEVYATVLDRSNRPVDGIARERFQILEDGAPQEIRSFETSSESISCAILLDTTGSMHDAIGGVKNAVSNLIDAMRPEDSVAIYSFSASLNTLQEFTTDKTAAKRAATRIRAQGETALFDAIAGVTREVQGREGKKAIVLFTDGADNASQIVASAAVRGAQKAGVPIYAVAEGDAVGDAALTKELRALAETTGGLFYRAKSSKDVAKVFSDIQSELKHLYLLSYSPRPNPGTKWRSIQLTIAGAKDYKVRGKQGYFP